MAFFQLILKAERLERARLVYEDEKLKSIEITTDVKPHLTLRQRLRRRRFKCARQYVTLDMHDRSILVFGNSDTFATLS